MDDGMQDRYEKACKKPKPEANTIRGGYCETVKLQQKSKKMASTMLGFQSALLITCGIACVAGQSPWGAAIVSACSYGSMGVGAMEGILGSRIQAAGSEAVQMAGMVGGPIGQLTGTIAASRPAPTAAANGDKAADKGAQALSCVTMALTGFKVGSLSHTIHENNKTVVANLDSAETVVDPSGNNFAGTISLNTTGGTPIANESVNYASSVVSNDQITVTATVTSSFSMSLR
jgi:hypothetical protein